MKKDMNQIVESFFAKKENVITTGLLEYLVREEFNKLLNEEAVAPIPKNFGIKSRKSQFLNLVGHRLLNQRLVQPLKFLLSRENS